MAVRKAEWPRGLRNWMWLTWFAVIGNIMPFFMISWATQHVASSLAGILMAINPLLVLLLARFLLAEVVRGEADHDQPAVLVQAVDFFEP